MQIVVACWFCTFRMLANGVSKCECVWCGPPFQANGLLDYWAKGYFFLDSAIWERVRQDWLEWDADIFTQVFGRRNTGSIQVALPKCCKDWGVEHRSQLVLAVAGCRFPSQFSSASLRLIPHKYALHYIASYLSMQYSTFPYTLSWGIGEFETNGLMGVVSEGCHCLQALISL